MGKNSGLYLGLGLGAAALGSFLFPQTTSMITGGMLGSSGTSGVGPVASGATYGSMLGGQSSSIFTNPTVLSAGILAGTSLLTNMFGSNAQDDAAKLNEAQLAENARQFDASLALKKEELAQALQLAQLQAGAARSAGNGAVQSANIARQTALQQARAGVIGQAAQGKAQALQLPIAAGEERVNAAQTTGAQSGSFFNNLVQGLQQPALRA